MTLTAPETLRRLPQPFRRNSSTARMIRCFVCAAVGVLLIDASAQAGIIWHGMGAWVTGGSRSGSIGWFSPIPSELTYQIDELDRPGVISGPPDKTFTYSVKTGIYQSVNSDWAALIVPDGILEFQSDEPMFGHLAILSVSAYGRLTGQNLVTAAAMRIWGTIAPGDQVYYSFAGGTSNFAGYGEPGVGFWFWDTLSTPGEFNVQHTFMSDVYATGRYGLDARMDLSFALNIRRGHSTEKTTIYIDPGVGTYKYGSSPDFPFLAPAHPVPEPTSALVLGGGLVSLICLRRRRPGRVVS